MRVSEIMIRSVTTVGPDDTINEARDRLDAGDIRHLPVVEDGDRLVGMVTDRDILRARALRPNPMARSSRKREVVSGIMSKPLYTTAPDAPAADAAQAMLDFKIESVPVIADGRLVGIVTATDFVALACRFLRQGP